MIFFHCETGDYCSFSKKEKSVCKHEYVHCYTRADPLS